MEVTRNDDDDYRKKLTNELDFFKKELSKKILEKAQQIWSESNIRQYVMLNTNNGILTYYNPTLNGSSIIVLFNWLLLESTEKGRPFDGNRFAQLCRRGLTKEQATLLIPKSRLKMIDQLSI